MKEIGSEVERLIGEVKVRGSCREASAGVVLSQAVEHFFER